MQVIYNEKINKIVKFFIPQELQMEGLVLAGGFATYLYYLSQKSNSELDKLYKDFVLKTCSLRATERSPFASDADYWIIEGTEAHRHFAMIAPPSAQDEMSLLDGKSLSGLQALAISRYVNPSKVFGSGRLTNFALTLISNAATLLANSGNHGFSGLYNHQIIRYAVWPDIESIFTNFDLNICQVAWYKGQLYISDAALEDFRQRKISFNKDFKFEKESCKTAWSINRVYKYYKRYGFEPENKDVNNIFNFYTHIFEYIKEFEEKLLDKKSKQAVSLSLFAQPTPPPVASTAKAIVTQSIPTIYTATFASALPIGAVDDEEYSKGSSDKYKLFQAYISLSNNLPILLSFDNFESHKAAFFLGFTSQVDNIVKQYFDLISELNQEAK